MKMAGFAKKESKDKIHFNDSTGPFDQSNLISKQERHNCATTICAETDLPPCN